MARVRLNQRRPRRSRIDLVGDALVAAGVKANVGMLPTIDVAYWGLAAKAFYDAVLAAGYTEVAKAGWPCDAEIVDTGEPLYRDSHEGVYRLPDGSIARVSAQGTWMNVQIASSSRKAAHLSMAAFQAQYPALFLKREDESGIVVPITFWMLSRFGPDRRLRRVAGTDWATVRGNYSGDVRDAVDRLTSDEFKPGAEGQLLLWYGPPGTGKTWAIRALASEWSSWAEFHYITDPDAFFVQDASYMVDVLLHESYEAIDEPTGDLVTTNAGDKWRVLILEDTGELLSADAKEKSGQGLSRLLNVVDGMIGQGLRILVLVTTNDEIEDLHPAVKRPGRCASQLVFGPLSAEEASEWAGREIDEPMSLAELYALGVAEPEVAFGPDPDEVGEEGAAAHHDLDGVPGLDPLTQAAVDAASAPLPALEPPADVPPVAAVSDAVDALRASAANGGGDASLVAALEAVAASHRTTVEAIASLAASGRTETQNGELAALSASALQIIERLASRPDPAPAPAPVVNVHMPEQPLSVNVEGARVEPHIHLPEQPAPIVNVAAQEAAPITVNVPAAEPASVHVDVHVPEQPPIVAPPVHVHVPAPAPRVVRIVEDEETGEKSFVSEDVQPVAAE